MLGLLGSDGLGDYVQIVMSNIFDYPFILCSLVIHACSPFLFIALAGE